LRSREDERDLVADPNIAGHGRPTSDAGKLLLVAMLSVIRLNSRLNRGVFGVFPRRARSQYDSLWLSDSGLVKCTNWQIGQLKAALLWKIPAVKRERIQEILLRESGVTQPAIVEAMGVSFSTVNRAHMAYDWRDQSAQARRPSASKCFARAGGAG
jgi:hypothetical protein